MTILTLTLSVRYDTNREGFLEMVEDSVKQSLMSVYDKQDPSCTLTFTEPSSAHDLVREMILKNLNEDDKATSDGDTAVNRQEGLENRHHIAQCEELVESFYNI